MLRYIPSIPSFIRVERMLNVVTGFFFIYWDDYLSLLLLICCITFNDLSILNHPCKNSMVLAQKQTKRPVKQNSRPGYKSMQLCSSYFLQRLPNIRQRNNILFNTCCWENWISACMIHAWNYIHVFYPVQVSTQSGIRAWNFEASVGKSREYTGINRHRRWLSK
jgi:hypothetical protein